jgi:hypothetical protein
MKNRNIVRFTAATFLTFLLAVPLLAQESRQVGQERARITREVNGRTYTIEVPVMLKATEANFVKYQSDLRAIILAQKEIAKMMHLDDKINEMLDPVLQQMPLLKFSDFPADYAGFPDLAPLKTAVLGQQQVIAQVIANGRAKTAQFVIPTDPFPGADYSLNLCPLNPQPGEVLYAAGWVLLAAETVRELAQNVCNETILAFVFGGNFSIACVATDLVFAAARVIYYPIKFCDDDTLGGQLKGADARAEYIKDQLFYSINNDDANKAALSTQMTNAESHIVINDNNNTAALSSQTAAFQTLTVRSAIERNLSADPTTTAAVGLFQLPASRGGYLEVARQTLIDTYNAQVAAAGPGVTVYNPSSELSLGATYTSQGKYREAYYYYRKGFRSVVKYP